MSIVYIALGGALGAVLRFFLTEYVNNNISNLVPFGTLFVNVVGCFVIGCIAGFFAGKSSPMYFFIVIGFLGSFTTMSAFSQQTIELLYNGKELNALMYVLASIITCLVGTFLAFYLFKTS